MKTSGRFQLPGRFLFLTLALFTLLLAYPFWGRDALGLASFDLVFWGVLLASIYAIGDKPWTFRVGLALAIPALLSDVSVYFLQEDWLALTSCLLDLLFLVFATGVIIAYVVRQERISMDKVLGAISGYLMLGLVWALIYAALELSQPGSFQLASDSGAVITHSIPHWGDLDNFIYYSLVTLSTLGYGDIIAVTRVARSWSAVEAIVGQLYLAILLARLIGLQLKQSHTA
ncbi:MAG: hypothetical protein GY703_19525 [Gammaproteobacteria bacterium]|nr:hypothetical protein [Gammaproteobacteria bacterium]